MRSNSPAERVFHNQFPKGSLQAINKNEREALTELIIYLANSYSIDMGVLKLIHLVKPLEIDHSLINNYLNDMLNKQITDWLVDEVSKEELTSRKEILSIIGNDNYYFDEDMGEELYEDEYL